jgi:thiamine-phosphate pyrophosphorylase
LVTVRPIPSRLLFIADAEHAGPLGLPDLVARAAAAGLDFMEIRRKGTLGSRERLEELRACRRAAPSACLLVNDRVDLAVAADLDGAHVGQDDLPVLEARALLGEGRMLGLSTHDEAQLAAAAGLPLDYVAMGPIFLSTTKAGHAEAIGVERLSAAALSCDLPLVAIGGIGPAQAADVLRAGAGCLAVASALSSGDLVANRAAMLRAMNS